MSVFALVAVSGLEAGFGGLVKQAAKNAAKKKAEQEVEKAVTKSIEKAISKDPEITMTEAEKAAARAEKLEAIDLDLESINPPDVDFAKDFTAANGVQKTIKKQPRIIVPGYRVVFSLENAGYAGMTGTGAGRSAAGHGAILAGRSGNTGLMGGLSKYSTSGDPKQLFKKAFLEGVTLQELQQIADQAYMHFLEELDASGYEYITVDEFSELDEFKNIELTETGPGKPYVQPGNDESRSSYAAFAPTGLPMWFTHQDKTTGVGDKGPMNLKNWKALNALSMETEAVILVPQIGINFARMEDAPMYSLPIVGSGRLDFNIGVHLDSRVTALSIYLGKTRKLGPLFAATLRKPVFLPYEFGVVEKVDSKRSTAISGIRYVWSLYHRQNPRNLRRDGKARRF